MQGKLIALEGLSASGKQTQARLLVGHLKHYGIRAASLAFPDYKSPYGRLIAKYLAGQLGPKKEVVEQASILYALDRYAHKKKIESLLEKGAWVIADRYSPSNYAFQGALAKNHSTLWKWIDTLESLLPQPDLVIFLDVPRTHTEKLYTRRRPKNRLTKKDIHETDAAFENKVYKNYRMLSRKKGWKVVRCVEKGRLLPVEKIHERVWAELRKLINRR